jgi:DUF4097 and DUF4098 domain-containing protein YvlB
MPSWTVDDSLGTVLEGVRELHVHLDAGEVAIAAGDCPSHLEIERLRGEPVLVDLADGVLDIRYERSLLSAALSRNKARVEVTVPARTDVMVRTASASVVAAGLVSETSLRTASGEVTLDRTAGRLHVRTASGDIDGREVLGSLHTETASGDLTIVAGRPEALSAKTASGRIVVDLELVPGGEYELATASGAVVVRLPDDASANVDVRTLSGRLDSAFDLGRGHTGHVGRQLVGALGDGESDLTVRTISGRVAVLRPTRVLA